MIKLLYLMISVMQPSSGIVFKIDISQQITPRCTNTKFHTGASQ